MMTERNKLSARKVAEACKPGYLLDGGGLYLQIWVRTSKRSTASQRKPSEAVGKSWCFRYCDRVTGKTREIGLGPLVDLSLAEAREKAAELRRLIRDGRDPLLLHQQKRAALKVAAEAMLNFDEAAERCIADKRPGWRNAFAALQNCQGFALQI